MYDGWRHLYFIYVPFILIAVVGLFHLSERTKRQFQNGKKIFLQELRIGVIGSIVFTLFHLIVYHPYQQIYFNPLVGDSIIRRFEMDYWGASFQMGIQKLIELEGEKNIKVKFSNEPGKYNLAFIPKKYKHNILSEKDILKADYYITNYRFHHDWHQYHIEKYPFDRELVHSWTFRGNPIMGIYKLR